MKKSLLVMVVLVSLIGSLASAADVATMVTLKADTFKAPDQERAEMYKAELYWQFKSLGAGLDVISIPKTDFLSANPYLTLKIRKTPIQLVSGVLTNSAGADYWHGGIWYCDSFGKANVFVEIREYIGSGEAVDFLDTFLEVTYSVTKKASIGINAIYDYNWTGSNRTWVQAGPILYYNVKDGVTLFVRATKETGEVDRLRVGIRFNF